MTSYTYIFYLGNFMWLHLILWCFYRFVKVLCKIYIRVFNSRVLANSLLKFCHNSVQNHDVCSFLPFYNTLSCALPLSAKTKTKIKQVNGRRRPRLPFQTATWNTATAVTLAFTFQVFRCTFSFFDYFVMS